MTSELTQALLKALVAGGYHAAPTKLVQGTGYYPLGDDPRMKTDPVEELEAHAHQHQQECWCDIKDLMSTGHSPSCPERIVRELQT